MLHRGPGRAAGVPGVVFFALISHGASVQDDNATFAIGYQRSLAYLPVILMDQQRLFEKHAARLGIKTTAEYRLLGGPAPIVDGLLSGSGTITVHGCSYPHALQEQDAGAHVILDSKEVLGGTNGMITGLVTSQRYCSANPKTCEALIAALTEAHQWINEDKNRAAKFFFDYGKTGETLPALQKQIKSSEVKFTIKPEGLQPFADFMYDVSKLVKTKLGYNDLVFDNLK